MRLQYYPETDMLYIMLQEGVSTESEEVAPCIVLDYNENNQVIGIEIEDASQRIDLSKLEVTALPLVAFALHNHRTYAMTWERQHPCWPPTGMSALPSA